MGNKYKPHSSFGTSPFKISPLKTAPNRIKIDRRYTIGMRKNILNFLVFITMFFGTFFCKPMATDQNQPKNVPLPISIIIGKNFSTLINAVGSRTELESIAENIEITTTI